MPDVAWALLDIMAALWAVMLVASGGAKLRRPQPAARFAAVLGVPAPRVSVLAVAALECGAGAVTLSGLAPVARGACLGLGLAFAALLVVHRLRTGARRVTCGCFGSDAALPIVAHVVVVLSGVTATTVVAVADRDPLVTTLRSAGWVASVLVAILVAAATSLVLLILYRDAEGARGAAARARTDPADLAVLDRLRPTTLP